jgi:hypothetical protein
MKSENIQAKRDQLKELSKEAAKFVEAEKAASINDALTIIYNCQGHEEIHSFKEWLNRGYVVKRGEKALLLWGTPFKAVQQEKDNENQKDEYKFFPLAFVFSNKQVEPIVTKHHAR